MELRQLEYFQELCRTRSFTKAAENLCVSQPSISKALQQLEQELGVTLLNRAQKPFSLTVKGQFFYERVSSILLALRDTVEEVSRPAAGFRCTVNIGLSPWTGLQFKRMLFSDQWAPPRHLIYNLVERSGPEIYRLLLQNVLSLGLVINVDRPRGLRFIPLETQEVCCALPVASPLAQKSRLRFADLAGESFAMNLESPDDSSLAKLVADGCRAAGYLPKVSVSLQQFLPTSDVARSLIQNGYGIMFGPARAVQELEGVAVRPMDPPLTVEIGIAWAAQRMLSAEEAAIVEYIQSAYPEYLQAIADA